MSSNLKVGDKVQFNRDVTWFDIVGPFGDHNPKDIAQPIWEVGTVGYISDVDGIWNRITTDTRPEGFGYPSDSYEAILPSQQ